MIAARLVRLIESHSDQLASGLMQKLLTSDKMADIRKVPQEEMKQRVYEVYAQLSDWLLKKTEGDVERWYTAIGARRATQGVALSHLVCAILAVKEHLWDFLRREAVAEKPLELIQQLDLLQMVDQFFDRAVYYAARGYESAQKGRVA